MNVGFRIPTNVDAEPLERTFDLRQYLNFLWRNWLFIASVTAIAFVIGVVNLMRAVPLYTASTQVLLQQHQNAPGLDASINDSRGDYSYIDNQLAILQSDSLLRRVVLKERLGIPQSTDPPKEDGTAPTFVSFTAWRSIESSKQGVSDRSSSMSR